MNTLRNSAALGLSLALLGGCTSAPALAPGPTASISSVDVSKTPGGDSQPSIPIGCVDPTDVGMQAALTLMDEQQTHPSYGSDVGKDTIEESWHKRALRRQQIAKNVGVTVFEAPPEYYKLRLASKEERAAMPFSMYLEMSSRFLSKYGVVIQVGRNDEDPNYGYSSRTPTGTELETEDAKNTLETIMWEYQELPKEYVALSGLKKIVLVAGTTEKAQAYVNNQPGKTPAYFVDIFQSAGSTVSKHELGHLIDYQTCGKGRVIQADPAFEAITANLPGYYSGIGHDRKYPSYRGTFFDATHADIRKRMDVATILKDKPAYCKVAKEYAALDVTLRAFTDYHPNPAEAKAEIAAATADTLSSDVVTSRRFPTIFKQTQIWLARLYDKAPNIVRYFTSIGDGYHDGTYYKCN